MTNDEINRYIHTEIMGKCLSYDYGSSCSDCGYHVDTQEHDAPPNYCSDASPRSLLDKVVAQMDANNFGVQLAEALDNIELDTTKAVWWPTAEQIARSCVEAHKTKGR